MIQHVLGLENEDDGTSCTPKVLVATHFHEIFANGLLDSSLGISYMHMEAVLSKTSGQLVEMDDATASMGTGNTDAAEQIEIHYLYRFGLDPLCWHLFLFSADRSVR